MKNRQVIDSWNQVQMDGTADQRILNAVLARNSLRTEKRGASAMNKRKYPGLAYALAVVLFISGLAAGAVFAEDIKGLVETVLSLGDGSTYPISKIGPVKIKDTAVISPGFIPLTIDEVEEMLGIKFLTTDRAAAAVVHYSTGLAKGKIGRVDLWWPGLIDFGKNDGKFISMSVAFLTPEAGREYSEPFAEGIDASGQKDVLGTYFLESLGEVVLYGNSWDETRLTATFVHQDMLYTFIASHLSPEEMFVILESLR